MLTIRADCRSPMQFLWLLSLVIVGTALSGFDKFMPKKSVELDADGKVNGAACRHTGRAIEDCFTLKPDALRSAVFGCWKEMNDYMREHAIVEIIPKQTAMNAA